LALVKKLVRGPLSEKFAHHWHRSFQEKLITDYTIDGMHPHDSYLFLTVLLLGQMYNEGNFLFGSDIVSFSGLSISSVTRDQVCSVRSQGMRGCPPYRTATRGGATGQFPAQKL